MRTGKLLSSIGLVTLVTLVGMAVPDRAVPVETATIAASAAETSLPAPFSEVRAFATKTGFRGVVTWQATDPVAPVIHYGTSPTALDQILPVADAPDTAGAAFIDGLTVGTTYYVSVEDSLTGTRTPPTAFIARNAFNDFAPNVEQDPGEVSFKPEVYTIDLVVQLDAQGLASDVPFDLSLDDIAAGVNVLAERVYDALDGHVRLGQVLVMDTVVGNGGTVPGVLPSDYPEICEFPTNKADVLVTTAKPADSHTIAYAITRPCSPVYLGRLAQLVLGLWRDDLHLGYVAAHEMMHYALGAFDLYDLSTTGESRGCFNLEWDGSLQNNLGGWYGDRWELTELDEDQALTPCDHGPAPWSWDQAQQQYRNLPSRTAVEDAVNFKPRGNPDGGALDIRILDREPGASTLRLYRPDDTSPEAPDCPPDRDLLHTEISDPQGDATEIGGAPTGAAPLNDPMHDVVAGAATFLPDGDPAVDDRDLLRLDVTLDEIPDEAPLTQIQQVSFELKLDSTIFEGSARREQGVERASIEGVPVRFRWDAASDTVTVWVPAVVRDETGTTVVRLRAADELRVSVHGARGVPTLGWLEVDTASGECAVVLPGEAVEEPPVVLPADAILTVGGRSDTATGGPYVAAPLPLPQLGGGCDALSTPCLERRLDLRAPSGGAILEVLVAPDPTMAEGSLDVHDPDGRVIASGFFHDTTTTFVVPVAAAGIHTVFITPQVGAGSIAATSRLVPPVTRTVDAVLTDGQTFEVRGAAPTASLRHYCSGPYDPSCVTYMLDLRAGGESGTLDVRITTPVPAEDFDAVLFDGRGRQVWFVGSYGTTVLEEGTSPPLSPGVYYLVAQPYTTRKGAPFQLTATLR